jgi:hypothetical protein
MMIAQLIEAFERASRWESEPKNEDAIRYGELNGAED